jgi:hypothetical protein
MAKQDAASSSSARRFWWVPVVLVVLVLAVIFGPSMLTWFTSGTGKSQGTITIATPTPLPYHPTYVEFRVDTPPWYTLGHQAAVKMADMLDASVKQGSNGIVFHCGYISSHSYFDRCVSFVIPAVPPLPPPPQKPKFTGDPYKDAKLRSDYQKTLASWQDAINATQKQLAAIRAQVHQETDQLRKMKFFYDDKASDPLSAITLASEHFQGVTAGRELLIASDMVQNVNPQDAGTITLTGVVVKLIYRTCTLSNAAACQANNAHWVRFFKQAGVKDVQIFDVAQSEALQLVL